MHACVYMINTVRYVKSYLVIPNRKFSLKLTNNLSCLYLNPPTPVIKISVSLSPLFPTQPSLYHTHKSMDKKQQCKTSQDPEVRKGPWTMEEDLILMNYIANHGEGVWNSLAKAAGKHIFRSSTFFIFYFLCILFFFFLTFSFKLKP